MNPETAFRFSLGFYWLFLGVWVGGMVMLVIAAATIFGTISEYQPTLGLKPYNDPVLAEHAPRILAGAITGNVLKGFCVLEIICAAVVAVGVVLQCTVFADHLRGGVAGGFNIARIVLLAIPILVLAADYFVISPRIWEQRSVMYDPVLTPAQRDGARAVFQRYHNMSTRMIGLATLCLVAAVLVSAFVFDNSSTTIAASGAIRGVAAGKDVGGG